MNLKQLKCKQECSIPQLSPSVPLPVTLRYDIIRGHTLTLLATIAIKVGIVISPVTMARRRIDWELVESRASPPSKRVTVISVTKKGPSCQRKMKIFSAGTFSAVAKRNLETGQVFSVNPHQCNQHNFSLAQWNPQKWRGLIQRH